MDSMGRMPTSANIIQQILFDLISTVETIESNGALKFWKEEIEAGTKVKVEERLASAKAELATAYDLIAEDIGGKAFDARRQESVPAAGSGSEPRSRPGMDSVAVSDVDGS